MKFLKEDINITVDDIKQSYTELYEEYFRFQDLAYDLIVTLEEAGYTNESKNVEIGLVNGILKDELLPELMDEKKWINDLE